MAENKSELVKWSSTFSVGVKIIDDQHRGLLDLVNDLFNHVSGDEEAEHAYFSQIVQQTVQYIKTHFSTEEKIMIHTKFPGYAEHKKIHDTFVLAVIEQIRNYEAGRRLMLSDFTRFLKEWILAHIAIVDKSYFSYFMDIATRKADGKLSINQSDVEGLH